MILLLLAIEGVADLHAVARREADGGGDAERNTLVGRAEHGVDVVRQVACLDLGGDLLSVERAERGDLPAVVECTGIDEVRGLTAGLERELAELQRLGFQQELCKTNIEGFSHCFPFPFLYRKLKYASASGGSRHAICIRLPPDAHRTLSARSARRRAWPQAPDDRQADRQARAPHAAERPDRTGRRRRPRRRWHRRTGIPTPSRRCRCRRCR